LNVAVVDCLLRQLEEELVHQNWPLGQDAEDLVAALVGVGARQYCRVMKEQVEEARAHGLEIAGDALQEGSRLERHNVLQRQRLFHQQGSLLVLPESVPGEVRKIPLP
jgi:hypothetical protein